MSERKCEHGYRHEYECEVCRNRPRMFQNTTWGDQGWWVGHGPLGSRQHCRFDSEADARAYMERIEAILS